LDQAQKEVDMAENALKELPEGDAAPLEKEGEEDVDAPKKSIMARVSRRGMKVQEFPPMPDDDFPTTRKRKEKPSHPVLTKEREEIMRGLKADTKGVAADGEEGGEEEDYPMIMELCCPCIIAVNEAIKDKMKAKEDDKLIDYYYDKDGFVRFKEVPILHDRLAEVKFLNEMNEEQTWEPGAEVYVISSKWCASWMQFVRDRDGQPGRISNHVLMEPETAWFEEGFKDNLYAVYHYRVISERSWNYLHSLYGGNPVIRLPTPDEDARLEPDDWSWLADVDLNTDATFEYVPEGAAEEKAEIPENEELLAENAEVVEPNEPVNELDGAEDIPEVRKKGRDAGVFLLSKGSCREAVTGGRGGEEVVNNPLIYSATGRGGRRVAHNVSSEEHGAGIAFDFAEIARALGGKETLELQSPMHGIKAEGDQEEKITAEEEDRDTLDQATAHQAAMLQSAWRGHVAGGGRRGDAYHAAKQPRRREAAGSRSRPLREEARRGDAHQAPQQQCSIEATGPRSRAGQTLRSQKIAAVAIATMFRVKVAKAVVRRPLGRVRRIVKVAVEHADGLHTHRDGSNCSFVVVSALDDGKSRALAEGKAPVQPNTLGADFTGEPSFLIPLCRTDCTSLAFTVLDKYTFKAPGFLGKRIVRLDRRALSKLRSPGAKPVHMVLSLRRWQRTVRLSPGKAATTAVGNMDFDGQGSLVVKFFPLPSCQSMACWGDCFKRGVLRSFWERGYFVLDGAEGILYRFDSVLSVRTPTETWRCSRRSRATGPSSGPTTTPRIRSTSTLTTPTASRGARPRATWSACASARAAARA